MSLIGFPLDFACLRLQLFRFRAPVKLAIMRARKSGRPPSLWQLKYFDYPYCIANRQGQNVARGDFLANPTHMLHVLARMARLDNLTGTAACAGKT
jgi:hypothetical protein